MKKIGFCINSLEMGGAEKVLVDMINALYEVDKFEIYLLTEEKSNSYFYNIIKNKVRYFYLIEKKEKKSIVLRLKNSIIKKINFKKFSQNLDVIIDFLDGDFCKYIKNLKEIKKLIWLHSSYYNLIVRKKIDKKINYYDKIIVISDGIEKELKEKNIHNYYKIYNIVDFENINFKLKEQIDERINKYLNEEYFLTVCRLNEEQKDVITLINSFNKYEGEEKLFIVGDGKDKEKLEKLALNSKKSEKIIFLGSIKNPFKLMKNSKVFILSSKVEGFGLVLVEALYCGTKVISSNCPVGPKEILLNGEIGELFEVGNIEELKNKLEIINKKAYNKELIKNSLMRYKKEYFIEKFCEVIDEKYV